MAPADVVELQPGNEARTLATMIQTAVHKEMRPVALGLWLLTARAYQWASLALVASAFGFTLYEPSVLRLVCASIFTLATQVPMYLHATKERAP